MTVPPEVSAYLASVREALDDLPGDERDDLLAEVEDSLVEAASEGGGPIVARLGQPEEFAAELRAAAGLHERRADIRRSQRVAVRELAARLAADDRVRAVRRLARELAPIWWVARGYVAVAALALMFGADWSIRHDWVPHIPTAEAGLALVVLAVAGSIWLGLRTRVGWQRLGRGVLIADLALVLASFAVISHLTENQPPQVQFVSIPAAPVPGLALSGAPVVNLYPYSRDGRLLHDVLLYDSAGNPIEIGHNGVADPQRRFLLTGSGAPIFNSFPIRYFEPGTARVAQPNAGPKVTLPSIATPALVTERGSKRRGGR